jgi:hypothetical protein
MCDRTVVTIALNELTAETLMNQAYLNQVKAQILGWTLS